MKITSLHQQTSLERVNPESGFGDVGEGGIVAGQLGIPMVGTLGDGQTWVYDSGSGTLIPGDVGPGIDLQDDGVSQVNPATVLNFRAGLTADASGNIDATGGLAWFNVKTYGAIGNGSTDDTAAINLAIAALVAAGKGVLYFPAGSYKTTAALTALSVPCTVLGDGASGWDGSTETASQVDCTSATASLFTVSSPAVKFEGLALLNTAGSTPSAGAGVTVTNGYGFKMVDCSIDGFWIDVDYQVGSIYSFVGTYFINPVKYAVKLRNTSVGDEGDGKFVNCWFYSNSHAADAAIRIESGGGIGITNCYINRLLPSTNYFVRGIDVANATVTSQLSIYGVQIENVSEDGIHIVSNGANTWDLISIVDCGIHLYRSSATTARAISISSDTLGDINTVVIEANNFKATAGSSVAAIGLTKVNNAVIGANLNDSNLPFLGYLSTSGCTAIYDQGGGVAAGVSITGTPTSGQVPTATSGTAATWQTPTGGSSFASPSIALGSSAAAGAASTVIRSDSTIAAFDTTAPTTQALGDSAVVGTAAFAARRDHKHAMPAAAVTSSGLTMTTNRLLGRVTASTGAIEEITLGTGLSFSGSALQSTGSSSPIASGTSFPGSPATNDLFFRTDRSLLYFYDGSQWLTLTLYREPIGVGDVLNNVSGASSVVQRGVTWNGVYNLYLVDFYAYVFVNGTNSGTNFWTVNFMKNPAGTTVATFTTAADAASTYVAHTVSINALIATTQFEWQVQAVKTLSPGNLFVNGAITYRLLG